MPAVDIPGTMPPFSWDDLGRFKRLGRFGDTYPPNLRRFFSPDDDVHGALVAVVKSARVSLAAAFYGWDDEEVDELFRAAWQTEGLPVLICLDKTQAAGLHERELLKAWPQDQLGNRLLIGQSPKHALNHLKLVVVDGIYTIGGSTNFSESGEGRQNNEFTIVKDATYAAETRAKVDIVADAMRTQMIRTGLGHVLAGAQP